MINKLFNKKEKQINKYRKVVDQVNALEGEVEKLSDEELRDKTGIFKEKLKDGAKLNDLLPEAFAVVKEASWRTLGKKHYDVQLIGGMALHDGYIAEMKTGEGKTLTELLPAYLNALAGKVHIVTVNDYLAKRDSDEMGKVFTFLGLTSGCIHSEMDTSFKKGIYKGDIIYGTSKEFGFDYLRDNMAVDKSKQVITGLDYVIVDEIDSVLIDESMTPLIITKPQDDKIETYIYVDRFVKTLERGDDIVDHETYYDKISDDLEFMDTEERGDFRVDKKRKSVILTDNGIRKAEEYFKLSSLADKENLVMNHLISQSLKANYSMDNNVDYLVEDNEVLIIDGSTGRTMPGRRFSDGLHQAIEAKEGVEIKEEAVDLATITLQNFYSLYGKLSGMTGTAMTEEKEFKETYNLEVLEIPTNKPNRREDRDDMVFVDEEDKYKAVINIIKEGNGAPILIGTPSIEKSELLSHELKEAGIKHRVLNAKNHKMEAGLIAQAGRLNAITIATNMAGRGTDIMLGGNPEVLAINEMKSLGFKEKLINYINSTNEFPDVPNKEDLIKTRELFNSLYEMYKEETEEEKQKVLELGGLRVIGTEKHSSRRIDNQLRGRAGRQGDPGTTVFMISLKDELLEAFGTQSLIKEVRKTLVKDEDYYKNGLDGTKTLRKLVLNAQKANEEFHFGSRKDLKEYDDVIHQHRNSVYDLRNEILHAEDQEELSKIYKKLIKQAPELLYNSYVENSDKKIAIDLINKTLEMYDPNYEPLPLNSSKSKAVKKLKEIALVKYEDVVEEVGSIEKELLIKMIDDFWILYIIDIKNLKDSVKMSAHGNQQPILQFKELSADVFKTYIDSIILESFNILYNILPTEIEEPAIL